MTFSTQRKERSTLPTATVLTRLLENRRPRMPLIRKPASGKIGMSQSCIGSVLVFHRKYSVQFQASAPDPRWVPRSRLRCAVRAATIRERLAKLFHTNLLVLHRIHVVDIQGGTALDRKSTRLNSSHLGI